MAETQKRLPGVIGPGRPTVGDRPMTVAERKARSRGNQLGELMAQLERAGKLAADWRRCMARGRPGATDADIQGAFEELVQIIDLAQMAVPKS